jgi:hypothetical protein
VANQENLNQLAMLFKFLKEKNILQLLQHLISDETTSELLEALQNNLNQVIELIKKHCDAIKIKINKQKTASVRMSASEIIRIMKE